MNFKTTFHCLVIKLENCSDDLLFNIATKISKHNCVVKTIDVDEYNSEKTISFINPDNKDLILYKTEDVIKLYFDNTMTNISSVVEIYNDIIEYMNYSDVY
ncbi:hypothetical protein [Paraclostridium bifermentans]|uniref:hypothetical protein n=1 Tax=Paraclostridium bifermentans TaxID=1490 RepID=UPI00359CA09D